MCIIYGVNLCVIDCRDKVTSYDLVAVICHHGTAGGMALAFSTFTSYILLCILAWVSQFSPSFSLF